MSYEIRHLTADEMLRVVGWAHAEGWKPGLYDLNAFLTVDPQGFMGGFLDGELVSSISAVRYPSGFAFVGFYIVKPEHRGTGLGYRLWQTAMQQVAGYNVGLDGVTAQVGNYAKSGFVLAHPNRRFVLSGGSVGKPQRTAEIVDARAVSIEEISIFDRRFFPATRRDFIAAWVSQPERHARAFLRDGKLAGYGVSRPCDGGRRIGPLFAESPGIARGILGSLAGAAEGADVYIDIPVRNGAAVAMAEEFRMESVFDTARMYTQAEPSIEHDGVFGITSLELG